MICPRQVEGMLLSLCSFTLRLTGEVLRMCLECCADTGEVTKLDELLHPAGGVILVILITFPMSEIYLWLLRFGALTRPGSSPSTFNVSSVYHHRLLIGFPPFRSLTERLRLLAIGAHVQENRGVIPALR
jgi:hypothetical protein